MKKNAEELKARILDGAVALFIEKGIEKVTTRELTGYLGISRSHIYHYFSDWQSLCLAALARFMESELDEIAVKMAGLSPWEKLTALVGYYLPSAPLAEWQLYDSLWRMAANNQAYADLAEANISRWMTLVAGIIDEGVEKEAFRPADINRVTRQLGALLNGYAETLIVNPSPEKHRTATEDIADFIRLVLGEPPSATTAGA